MLSSLSCYIDERYVTIHHLLYLTKNQIDYLSQELTCLGVCIAWLLEPKGTLCLLTIYVPLWLYTFNFLRCFILLKLLKVFYFS